MDASAAISSFVDGRRRLAPGRGSLGRAEAPWCVQCQCLELKVGARRGHCPSTKDDTLEISSLLSLHDRLRHAVKATLTGVPTRGTLSPSRWPSETSRADEELSEGRPCCVQCTKGGLRRGGRSDLAGWPGPRAGSSDQPGLEDLPWSRSRAWRW